MYTCVSFLPQSLESTEEREVTSKQVSHSQVLLIIFKIGQWDRMNRRVGRVTSVRVMGVKDL